VVSVLWYFITFEQLRTAWIVFVKGDGCVMSLDISRMMIQSNQKYFQWGMVESWTAYQPWCAFISSGDSRRIHPSWLIIVCSSRGLYTTNSLVPKLSSKNLGCSKNILYASPWDSYRLFQRQQVKLQLRRWKMQLLKRARGRPQVSATTLIKWYCRPATLVK